MKKRNITLVLCACLVSALWAQTGNLNKFTAKMLDGTAVTQDIFKDYDITMINIWATWCPPCIREMPDLQKVYENLPPKANMITIGTDAADASDTAKKILASVNATFPVIVSNRELETRLLRQITAIPTTIFVDRDGNLVGRAIVGVPPGRNPSEQYLSTIKSRLDQVR